MYSPLKDLNRVWSIIHQIAENEGTTPDVIRKEMAKAIEEAWATPDPTAKTLQDLLFPNGKPTVESFIINFTNMK